MMSSICMIRKPIYHFILSKGFSSAMFTTLYSISLYAQCSHQTGAVYLCTQRQRRCSVCCPVTLNICFQRVFAPMVCFVCMIFIIKLYEICFLLELTEGCEKYCKTSAEGFSITFEESISYLRYDYYPLAIISFYRITH